MKIGSLVQHKHDPGFGIVTRIHRGLLTVKWLGPRSPMSPVLIYDERWLANELIEVSPNTSTDATEGPCEKP